MQNDWYFIGLYHTQLNAEWLHFIDCINYAEWLILFDCTQLSYDDWYFIGLYHTQLNYAEWLILYWIVPYSTKLCRMIDTLLNCTILN